MVSNIPTVKVLEELSEVEQLRLQVQLLKKVSELGQAIDKVKSYQAGGKIQENLSYVSYPGLFRRQTLNFLPLESKKRKLEKRDEVVEKIEQLCMEHHFIYGYRTITRLLKKIHGLILNRKKGLSNYEGE